MCDKDLFLLHTKNNQRFSLIYSVVSMSSPLFADIIDGYSILCYLTEVRRAIFPYRKPWNFLMGTGHRGSFRIKKIFVAIKVLRVPLMMRCLFYNGVESFQFTS